MPGYFLPGTKTNYGQIFKYQGDAVAQNFWNLDQLIANSEVKEVKKFILRSTILIFHHLLKIPFNFSEIQFIRH